MPPPASYIEYFSSHLKKSREESFSYSSVLSMYDVGRVTDVVPNFEY